MKFLKKKTDKEKEKPADKKKDSGKEEREKEKEKKKALKKTKSEERVNKSAKIEKKTKSKAPIEDDASKSADGMSNSDKSESDAVLSREDSGYNWKDMMLFGQNKVTKDDFVIQSVIGKGSFGKVFLVTYNGDQNFYAMKVLRKEAIRQRRQVAHTNAEKTIMQKVRHPFIVRLFWAFQTPDKLYMVMEFINGGELFFHLKQDGRFSEERVRLYGAEIGMALAHLHSLGIVYRDLKPENILLNSDGHVVITDFGLSKEITTEGTQTFCGTPEYLAPEILKGKGHNTAVDWWSLGTLLFEMLTGLPPFYANNVNVMYQKILTAELQFPNYISAEARDLLERLLDRDPDSRLGTGRGPFYKPGEGEEEEESFFSHAFFRNLDWQAVYDRQVKPPFIPEVRGKTDLSNIDPLFTQERPVDSLVESSAINDVKNDDDDFSGFTFQTDSLLQKVEQ